MTRFVGLSALILLIAACCSTQHEGESNAFAHADCEFHRQTLFDSARDEIILQTCIISRADACELGDKSCVIEAQFSCTEDFLRKKADALQDSREKKCHLDSSSSLEI